MDEQEFRRLLDLFPVVRSRDYFAESGASTSRSTQDELIDWQDAWGEDDKGTKETQRTDNEGAFWSKLRLAAEKKVGPAEADRFTKAFQRVHNKLVYEELSLDAARKMVNSAN